MSLVGGSLRSFAGREAASPIACTKRCAGREAGRRVREPVTGLACARGRRTRSVEPPNEFDPI